MELNAEVLARHKGGQLEIQNPRDGYIYRGEIDEATLEDGDVKVKFKWCAKGNDFPPTSWVKEEMPEYSASLMIYQVSEIGDGRLAIASFVTHELAIFFLPGGSALDPARVEGLELAA